MFKVSYLSPIGPLVLIASGGRIVYCNWSSSDCKYKEKSLIEKLDGCESEEDRVVINRAICQLDEYFERKRELFDLPIEFIGSEFQKFVWLSICKIGYGRTISYKELAQMIGKPTAVRAVANACGANPLGIIIPCHRVVSSLGKLGGYTGGLNKKIALLQLENQNNDFIYKDEFR